MPPATTLLNPSMKTHKNKSEIIKIKTQTIKSECIIIKIEGMKHTHLLKC